MEARSWRGGSGGVDTTLLYYFTLDSVLARHALRPTTPRSKVRAAGLSGADSLDHASQVTPCFHRALPTWLCAR